MSSVVYDRTIVPLADLRPAGAGRDLALAALAAALENVSAAAFVLSGREMVHANDAGRALLATARERTVAELDDLAAGRERPEYLCSCLSAPGVPTHLIAVRREPRDAPPDRLALLVARCRLTRRQGEVLGLVVHGKSNKSIASTLACSESTVEFHVTALLQKLQCESRAALVARFWSELPAS